MLAAGLIPTYWQTCAVVQTVKHVSIRIAETGGRLNKKDGLTRYGDSHVKDKTS